MQNYSPKEIPLGTFLSRSPTIPQADNRILEAQALIHSIQVEICQLKEYKNFCAVVSKLPHEILSLIFTVQTLEEDNCRDLLSHRVSWVCRRWRDIALSTPRLWNTICIGSQEPWVKLLLERSKAAPLHILESGPSTRLPPSLPIILTHSARIQRMHFPYEAKHFLEPIFRGSFPSLKFLHVSANFKPRAKDFSPFDMPVLKDLTLSMDPLHLKRIPTHNLETLRIDLSPSYDSRKITTNDMFALLRQCPQLTSLSLHHAMQGGSVGPEDSSHEPIVLPYLTNIDLLADYISDLSIFVLLRAQRLRNVKAGSERPASVEDVEQIVPYIFEALPKEASWWNVVAPTIDTLDLSDFPGLVLCPWHSSSFISVRMWRDITPQNPKFTNLPAIWLEIAGDIKTERRTECTVLSLL
ncbi:hypothetical protein ONZ45_g10643 [Pleurotus djamor]|nr:hypothetical protein ONZ45_g10643 [Pleurotus djamor]